MTRKEKIEMRTQYATILDKIMQRHKPCVGSWEDNNEDTRRTEFYKMSSLYYEISDLRDLLYKMNKYSEMLED